MEDDRVRPGADGAGLPKPEVTIVVEGNRITKPGMRAFYAEDAQGNASVRTGGQVITHTVCTCNYAPICSCVGYEKPPCGNYLHHCAYCTCVPVH